jgi:hypothetical protein
MIPRLAKEGVVRVSKPALCRQLRELFVGERRLLTKAGWALERYSQHRHTRPVAL